MSVLGLSYAPGVVGKFVELSMPATYAAPVPSTAIAVAEVAKPLRDRAAQGRSSTANDEPSDESFVTNAFVPPLLAPLYVVSYAPAVVGKSVEPVDPVT